VVLRLQKQTAMRAEVDTLNHCVRLGAMTHGKLGAGPGEFHYPACIAVLDNRAYVADSWNHRIQAFDLPDWQFAFEFGDFFCPKWIGVVEDRGAPLLAIVDTNNARICFHRPDGRRVAVCDFEYRRFPVAARPTGTGALEIVFEDDHVEMLRISDVIRPRWWTTRFDKPISLARDRSGWIYVSDIDRRVVEKFDADGNFISQILGPEVLKESGRMIMNGDDLIVTDRAANHVVLYDTVAGKHRVWEFPFDNPGFLGRDTVGQIWVGTYVDCPNAKGASFSVFDSGYRFIRNVEFAEALQPTFISFASNRILIADQDARNVLIFSCDGEFEGSIRNDPYEKPVWTIATDGAAHIDVGTGAIADILWAPDINRRYYIDLESSAVRYSEA
jgi:sugar lactone lactonase YvrE